MIEVAERTRELVFPVAYGAIGLLCALLVLGSPKTRASQISDAALTFALWPLMGPVFLLSRPRSVVEAGAKGGSLLGAEERGLMHRATARVSVLSQRIANLSHMRSEVEGRQGALARRMGDLIALEIAQAAAEIQKLQRLVTELESQDTLHKLTSELEQDRRPKSDLTRELSIQLETCQELVELSFEGIEGRSNLKPSDQLGKVNPCPES